MEPLTIRSIVEVVGGRWLPVEESAFASRGEGCSSSRQPPPEVFTDSVSTDSRDVAPGGLFVAIVGDRLDGHCFVGDVVGRAGAALVAEDHLDDVVRQLRQPRTMEATGETFGLIVVDDTLDALERLAKWYRRQLSARVIGITGSCGKTTVKEFTGQLLERSFETVRAQKSFNNRLGVALTLLDAVQSTRFLVVEIGTNAPGEIEHLASIVEPDICIVTGVSAAHLGGLGSLDGIAREKSAIIGGLRPEGLVFLPAKLHGDRYFLDAAAEAGAFVRRFGWYEERCCDAQYLVTRCEALTFGGEADGRRDRKGEQDDWCPTGQRPIGHRFEIQHGQAFELRLPGRHNVLNALVAIAIGREVGLDWATLRDAVRSLSLPPLRLSVAEVAGVTVVDDSYNANPSSVRAAFAAVEELRLASGGRWHVVLGDLLELGPESSAIHGQLGEELVGSGCFSTVWTVGSLAQRSCRVTEAHGLPSVSVTIDQRDAVVAPLVETLRPGDGVLFKGSRGVGLDRTAALLRSALADRREAAPEHHLEGTQGAGTRR